MSRRPLPPPRPAPLTASEKAAFDTIRNLAAQNGRLQLLRMTLDGQQVAVVAAEVQSAITGDPIGVMPLALILDDATSSRLRDVTGEGPDQVDPFGLR